MHRDRQGQRGFRGRAAEARVGKHRDACVLRSRPVAVVKQCGERVVHFVMRGARALQLEREQQRIFGVIVQMIAVIFLPQAAVDELHLIARALQQHGVAAIGTRVDRARGEIERQRFERAAVVEIDDMRIGWRSLADDEAAGGLDMIMIVIIDGRQRVLVVATDEREQGDGKQGRKLGTGESVAGHGVYSG